MCVEPYNDDDDGGGNDDVILFHDNLPGANCFMCYPDGLTYACEVIHSIHSYIYYILNAHTHISIAYT